MAQSVKCQTLGSGSDHYLGVSEFEPCTELLTDNTEPAWDSLFLSLSLALALALTLSLCPSSACALSLSK